jgi:rhamnosyltransferase
MLSAKVLVVIVLYYPDENQLLQLVGICSQYKQASILLFDNGKISDSLKQKVLGPIAYYLQSPKNVGVGEAYDYACQLAVKEKFDFILSLDQDSCLPHRFINNMVSGFFRLQKLGFCLAAIGPAWYDPRFPIYIVKRWRIKLRSKRGNGFLLKKVLISSGMLITVSALKKIGYPKKEYFIDHIDTEWCLRAYYRHYRVAQLSNVHMQHTLGKLRMIRNFSLRYQEPIRYYYSIRNSFFMFTEKRIAFFSRIYILLRNIVEIGKLPFVPQPLESCLAVWFGLKDGVKKVLFNEDTLNGRKWSNRT